MVMEVQCESLMLTMLDEREYSAGSADNVRSYDRELDLSDEFRPSSRHGLICRELDGAEHSCVLLAAGGSSRVHEHSAVVLKGVCFVAVGDMVCSLSLPTLVLNWATKVDGATCFGIYYSPRYDCLLSHGELEIARVNLLGEIVWSAGGADIFSEGFRVVDDQVEAVDFKGQVYRTDIGTGRSEVIDPPNNCCT